MIDDDDDDDDDDCFDNGIIYLSLFRIHFHNLYQHLHHQNYHQSSSPTYHSYHHHHHYYHHHHHHHHHFCSISYRTITGLEAQSLGLVLKCFDSEVTIVMIYTYSYDVFFSTLDRYDDSFMYVCMYVSMIYYIISSLI